MSFFNWLKSIFLKLFDHTTDDKPQAVEVSENPCEVTPIEDTNSNPEMFEKFKFENIIYKKLNFLEEYINSFAQSHPNQYAEYSKRIQTQRSSYDAELQAYLRGFEGNITFSIDPERESLRRIQIQELEKEIYDFVNNVVLYEKYKENFSILCSKSNTLYNAIINWRISPSKIKEHFNNANLACEKLISEVQQLSFFEHDSRKKEKILQHIIYFDYLLFKSALRYKFCDSLNSYKSTISKLHNLFVDTEYNDSILKFFMKDLECIKAFLTSNLQSYACYPQLMETCEQLQTKAQASQDDCIETASFEKIIKLENTLEEAGKSRGVDFILTLPDSFDATVSKTASVNTIAISVLNLINKDSAYILLELIKGFKIDISWKEFYFLCRIFELYEDVVLMSRSTVFTSVESKFLEFAKKYPQYSSAYITEQKKKLLMYRGSKKKKYVLLFDVGQVDSYFIAQQLEELQLDFFVNSNGIYLNHSYFNGFKNLEQIFGNYIII